LSAKYVLVIISAIHGLNLFALYLVIRIGLQFNNKYNNKILAFVCAIFGLFSPFFITMIGATWTDNLTPILILFGLWLLIKNLILNHKNFYLLFLSGLLFGFSLAIKLTNLAFIFGLLSAFIYLIIKNKTNRLKFCLTLFTPLCSILIGFLIVNGFWMYELYSNFQNPVFPLFNNFFKSPDLVEVYVTTIKPWAAAQNILDFVRYPFQWAVGIPPPSEWEFRDVRYAFIFLAVLLAVFLKIRKYYLKNKTDNNDDYINTKYELIRGFILTWCLFSYLFWEDKFGSLRYIIPVSLLTGLVIVYLIDIIIKNNKNILKYIYIIFIMISIFNQKPPYGRLKLSENWNRPSIPEVMLSKPYVYLKNGVSIAIPFLNKDSIFIGYPYYNLVDGFYRKAKNIINQTSLEIRTLTDNRSDPNDIEHLRLLGLQKNLFDCLYFNIGPVNYQSCGLNKIEHDKKLSFIPPYTKLDFSQKFPHLLNSLEGFHSTEQYGTWTSANRSDIYLGARLPRKFTLRLTAFSFDKVTETGLDITVGNEKRHIYFDSESSINYVDFSLAESFDNINKISIDISKIYSPSEVSKSTDIRKLGLHLQSIEVMPYGHREYSFGNYSDAKIKFDTLSGFSDQEPTGVWTNSLRSTIQLEKQILKNSIIEIVASSLPQFNNNDFFILIGNVRYPMILISERAIYKIKVHNPSDEIVFEIPFANSPKNLGLSSDERQLGIFIEKIKITPY